MTRRFCDLCGKEIIVYGKPDKTKWKMKYHYDEDYYGRPMSATGWCKIDAHEECLKAVAKEARLHGVEMKGWGRKEKRE